MGLGISSIALQALRDSQLVSTSEQSSNSVAAFPRMTDLDETIDADLKRAKKRRRTSGGRPEYTVAMEKRYDSTGLVPHYKRVHEVPDSLKKCMPSSGST